MTNILALQARKNRAAYFANEALNSRILIASAVIIGSVIFINYARQISARKAEAEVVPQEIE